MYFNRSELKDNAKDFLRSHYIYAFIICAIIIIICGGDLPFTFKYNFSTGGHFGVTGILAFLAAFIFSFIGIIIGFIVRIFILNPLRLGKIRYFIGDDYDSVRDLFFSFTSNSYFNIVKTLFIKDLVIVLYSFLLVIPGIIKSYQLRMVDYILVEHPEMNAMDILALSTDMTRNKKMDIFYLDLSFIGWYMLGALFLGLPLFFIQPYFDATYAQLFLKLKLSDRDYYYT